MGPRKIRSNLKIFDLDQFGSTPTRQVHSCLKNFDAMGYHHLGEGSNESSAYDISQAHPADLLNISKLINF